MSRLYVQLHLTNTLCIIELHKFLGTIVIEIFSKAHKKLWNVIVPKKGIYCSCNSAHKSLQLKECKQDLSFAICLYKNEIKQIEDPSTILTESRLE